MKKKLLILLPSLAATASMPLLSLVGCGCQPPSKEVKFSIADKSTTSAYEANIVLKWTKGHDLEFDPSSWSFTCASGEASNISFDDTKGKLTLKFDEPQDDIVNGKLSFTYSDLTTEEAGIVVNIQNIFIDAPERKSFNICDWQDVVNSCREYENTHDPKAFLNNFYFGNAGSKDYPKTLEDFAGQQRTVYLDGLLEQNKYTVKVLGIGQDFTNPPHDCVGMTFQFDTPVGDTYGSPYEWNYEENNRVFWQTPLCQNVLLGEGDQGLLTRIKSFGNNPKSVLLPVQRKVLINGKEDMKPGNWFFMPVLGDIFSISGLMNSFDGATQTYIPESMGEDFRGSNLEYTYYKEYVGGNNPLAQKDVIESANQFPCLIKKDHGNKPVNYWITTPYMKDTTSAFCIDSKNGGKISTTIVINFADYYIAPCFCI
ncbi:MAG: hypothetical protein ACOQNY_01425 [Mycoplasmoidaceae bacterium]